MFKKLFANVLSFIGIFLVTFVMVFEAKAEYCNMVGGEKEVHWIYVPRTQYNFFNGKKEIKRSLRTADGKRVSKVYKYNMKNRLFSDYDSLPKVNDVATLNVNVFANHIPSCLMMNKCSNEQLKYWEKIKKIDGYEPLIYNKNGTVEINDDAYMAYGGGRLGNWTINKNAKVRILGYQYIDNILFALVYVISC